MVLRTLVAKLREAKIVSSQTPIHVFTTKFNGKLDYKARCIDIDSSNVQTFLLRQCTVKDFSVNDIGDIIILIVRISADDYREALNKLMQSYMYKANNKSSVLTEFERQYAKLLLLDTDGILYD